jgi:tetratricopeptide (TPR) repeat protein
LNYYELLNIARDADNNAIKRAYFSAVKLHSPDTDPEGFKAVRTAYETLSDQKRRAEYDAYFIASSGGDIAADVQTDLLAAREMLRENKYYQAEVFMTELTGKYPDSSEVKCLHAEVLWLLKKTGTAEKLLAELLEKDPSCYDALLLRAKIAVSKGHTEKAVVYFNETVKLDPQNPRAWIEYMKYTIHHSSSRTLNVFTRAMELDKDMFRDDYMLYLIGATNIDIEKINVEQDLFFDSNWVQYYDKFADFFINDTNPTEDIFVQIMNLMLFFIKNEELLPFIEKILPVLENSRFKTDDDIVSFKYIRAGVVLQKLRQDKRIHDVLAELTSILYTEDANKEEQLSMECYIAFHMLSLRPSIKVLMNEYPEQFKLNQAFYYDVLNEKKNDYLIDKYSGIYKRLNPSAKMNLDYIDDGLDNTEEVTPFVRESPKTGRNDPCPCGSGKKYKKCCG